MLSKLVKRVVEGLSITELIELNNAYCKKTRELKAVSMKGKTIYYNDPEKLVQFVGGVGKLIAGILNEGSYSLLDPYVVIEADTVNSYGEEEVREIIDKVKEYIVKKITNSINDKDTEWIPTHTFNKIQVRMRLPLNMVI